MTTYKRRNKEFYESLAQDKKAGLTHEEMAKKYNLSVPSIRNYLTNLNTWAAFKAVNIRMIEENIFDVCVHYAQNKYRFKTGSDLKRYLMSIKVFE